ncbi:YjbE family putative metal transport protein [Phenylobacterium soli]|uniref:TerC family protein n=1 Tax=Phenylobacterium soli TaxID=2170551 RepID=A0A328AM29_9CAUL|nr:YjbE family putative metal transport protein [Phenylobacterium soli]RAK55046.1 TerC family protein [Phenylobacterium soli]
MSLPHLLDAGAVTAFFQVVLIDVALAGDNAVAVGLVAAALPPKERRRAIFLGLAGAVVMRIGFALIAAQLMQLVGLLLTGGLLLLWVCWKMWRELRESARAEEAEGRAALEEAAGPETETPAALPSRRTAKTMGGALLQILLADLTMSLDNVLAVAGAAHKHPAILAAGVLISITLMGVAASWIARLLHRFRWIGYLGLVIVLYVAVHMIWEGSRTVAIDLGQTPRYNAAMPAPLDIKPEEAARRAKKAP